VRCGARRWSKSCSRPVLRPFNRCVHMPVHQVAARHHVAIAGSSRRALCSQPLRLSSRNVASTRGENCQTGGQCEQSHASRRSAGCCDDAAGTRTRQHELNRDSPPRAATRAIDSDASEAAVSGNTAPGRCNEGLIMRPSCPCTVPTAIVPRRRQRLARRRVNAGFEVSINCGPDPIQWTVSLS
jgi:hypothetical protein